MRRIRKLANARLLLRILLPPVLLLGGLAVIVSRGELPPYQPADLPGPRGVFHVHSDASHDGKVAYAELIAAGRRVGADFLIFTEHNRLPAREQPEGGPTVVSATELSTSSGHLIQLGLDFVPPKAMRDSSTLIGVLHESGALAIASHPESPKRPWVGADSLLDGLEIASSSADFRVRTEDGYLSLAGPLFAYAVNPHLALAQLYRRDSASLGRWDAQADRRVIGICGTDTHGWIAPERQYRTWQVVLDVFDPPPTRLLPEHVVGRIRDGRFFCLAGLPEGGTPEFSFNAVGQGRIIPQGGSASRDSLDALVVHAPVFDVDPATIVLLRDGVEVARADGTDLRYDLPARGTYRVEVLARLPRIFGGDFEVPVLYSNRIRIVD